MPSNTKTSSYDTFPTAEDEESSNTLLTSSAAAAGTTEGGKIEAATVLLLLLPWKNIGMLLSVLGLVISAVALLKNTGNTSRSSSSATSTSELSMLASSTNEPTDKQCFANRGELKTAVDKYVSKHCNDYRNKDATCADIYSKYGWPMNSWCVGKVTDMSDLFNGMSTFNEDISSWDVSRVQDMSHMFLDASSFNGDISLWNVSRVRYMYIMFVGAKSFNADISLWDVSQVQDMVGMFNDASSFNQNLCAWADKNFPYAKASDIFVDSGCKYKGDPKKYQGGPFCKSTCN